MALLASASVFLTELDGFQAFQQSHLTSDFLISGFITG